MKHFFQKLVVFAVIFLIASGEVRADFKLLDAIEEFGEKRFIKATPQRLKAGPVLFHPTLRTSAGYDNNILLEPKDKRGDMVLNITPGAIVELPFKTHQIAVGYEADAEIFTKTRDKRQNDINQNFFALTDFRFPDWYVNMLEYFSETSSRSGTTFTGRIPRYDQSVNPKIGYKWKRLTFETGFRHYVRDFRRHAEKAFDFQEVEWNNVVYYDLFARLKALVDYQFAQIDYSNNEQRTTTINQARLGLEGELMTNLFAKVRVGPQFRNSRKSSEPDFYSIVGSVQLEYQVRKNLKLKAKASREPVEATFGNVNYYVEHSFGGGFEYQFHPRWSFYNENTFYRHNYSERELVNNSEFGFRRDNHIDIKTGLRYQFREWWQFELAYEYWHRHSNFHSFNFDDNRVTLSSNLAY